MISDIKKDLKKRSSKEKAKLLQRFFKTGNGEYGEGDVFIGVMMPLQREVAKKHKYISIKDVEKLLKSKIHEHRMTALLILTYKFETVSDAEKKRIYKTYLRNTKYINNWDLVDVTCHKIVGEYLVDKKRDVLYKLARSKNLWERRIAIISTFAFFRENDYKDSMKLAHVLRDDKHDLMHKAVGWTLREVGKRDKKLLIKFLDKHYKHMPRTSLRYSIERLSDKEKKHYMKK